MWLGQGRWGRQDEAGRAGQELLPAEARGLSEDLGTGLQEPRKMISTFSDVIQTTVKFSSCRHRLENVFIRSIFFFFVKMILITNELHFYLPSSLFSYGSRDTYVYT